MIDTITYICFLELLPPEQWLKGWRGWRPEGEDSRPFQGYERMIKHSLLGLRLFVRAGMVVKVNGELPKLLYGRNGRLIKSQDAPDRGRVLPTPARCVARRATSYRSALC